MGGRVSGLVDANGNMLYPTYPGGSSKGETNPSSAGGGILAGGMLVGGNGVLGVDKLTGGNKRSLFVKSFRVGPHVYDEPDDAVMFTFPLVRMR